MEDVELGGVWDEVSKILLKEEGVDGAHDSQSALEAGRDQCQEEVEVRGDGAFPPAGNCDEGVEAGETGPSRGHEVDSWLAFQDEVGEIFDIFGQVEAEGFFEVIPDVYKFSCGWVGTELLAKARKLTRKRNRVSRRVREFLAMFVNEMNCNILSWVQQIITDKLRENIGMVFGLLESIYKNDWFESYFIDNKISNNNRG